MRGVGTWFVVTLCVLSVPAAQAAESGAENHAPPGSAPVQSAGSGAQPADPRDQEIEALRRQVEELRRRVEELEKRERERQPPAAPEPPGEPAPTPAPPGAGTERQLPDFSFIADGIGRFSNRSASPERGKIRIREVELALQGFIYPQIRGDVFVALEGEELNARLEEAYLTFLQIGNTRFAGRLGQMFVDFGRLNKLHRELWHHADKPAVLRVFLGEEPLIGRGVEVSYLIPTPRGWFAQAAIGRHDGVRHGHGEEDEDEGGSPFLEETPFDDRLYNARLWLSRAISADSELELGLSHLWGRGEREDGRRDPLRVLGADLVYRRQPAAHRVLRLQGEFLRFHRRFANGGETRQGAYLLGWYRWNRFWSGGLRGDYVELISPFRGAERAAVAFLTRHLSETSYLRFQLKHGRRSDIGSFSEAWLQFVFGIGPHAHRLE